MPSYTKLTLFNGSPRGAKGNSPILLNRMAEGFAAGGGQVEEMHHLNLVNQQERFLQAFAQAELVAIGFPLYTDSMPGLVKHFIEGLAPLCGRPDNPALMFVVQCGFPEAAHIRPIERYLEKLAARLGSAYLGTVVKGNGEPIRLMPDNMNRKLFEGMRALGQGLAAQGQLDPALLKQLAGTERFPGWSAPFFKLALRLPVASMYWDQQLKENGVYEQRDARPYLN